MIYVRGIVFIFFAAFGRNALAQSVFVKALHDSVQFREIEQTTYSTLFSQIALPAQQDSVARRVIASSIRRRAGLDEHSPIFDDSVAVILEARNRELAKLIPSAQQLARFERNSKRAIFVRDIRK